MDSSGGAKAAPVVDPWIGFLWLAQYLGPGAGSDLVICAPLGEPPKLSTQCSEYIEISNVQKCTYTVLSICTAMQTALASSCKAQPGSLLLS